jgi:rhodanese-related sulfurtransferase
VRPGPDLPSVDVRTAAERLAAPDPPLLVDVREPTEFETVRIEGAVLMPLSTFAVHFQELPRDRPLLMQCAVGGRSATATAHLLASGYRDVTNVAGGIVSWERAGLPVKRGRVEPGEGDLPA